MPIRAEFDGQIHEFPDGTTDDEIRSALYEVSPPKPDTGVLAAVKRVLDPRPLLDLHSQSMQESTIPGESLLRTAGKVAKGIAGAQVHEFARAKEEFDKGQYGAAAASAVFGALPVVGPMVSSLADRAAAGDVSGAITEGALLSGVPTRVVGSAVRLAGRAPLGRTKAGAATAAELERRAAEQAAMTSGRTAPPMRAEYQPTPVTGTPAPIDPYATLPEPAIPGPRLVNETALRNDLSYGAKRGVDEALRLIPAATSPEVAGAGVQGILRQGSDIWHRRGGELYEEAGALLKGEQIPTHPVRSVADRLLHQSESTREYFPESGSFPPDIYKALNEISELPETVPYEVLDNYRQFIRQKLPEATELAASQKEGLAKLITGGLTEAMVEGAEKIGGDAAAAAAAARAFWKEGAELYNNAILSKAMTSTPEDVISLVKPVTGRTSAAVTEARRLKEGVLDYAEKYGTDVEKASARKSYNTFLEMLLDRGIRADDVMKLPSNYAAYGEVVDILYNATTEGRRMLSNLDRVANAVGELQARVRGIPKPEKLKKSVVAEHVLESGKRLEKKYAAERKVTAAETAAREAEVAASQARAREAAKSRSEALDAGMLTEKNITAAHMKTLVGYQNLIANALAAGFAVAGAKIVGWGGGGLIAAGAVGAPVRAILKSDRATAYFVHGISSAQRAGEMIGQQAGTSAWLKSINRAAQIAAEEEAGGKKKPRTIGQAVDEYKVRGEVDGLRSRHGQNWDAALSEVNQNYRSNPALWKAVRGGIVEERKRAKSSPSTPRQSNVDGVTPLLNNLIQGLRNTDPNSRKATIDSWRKLKLVNNDVLDALERESGLQ